MSDFIKMLAISTTIACAIIGLFTVVVSSTVDIVCVNTNKQEVICTLK